MNFNLRNPLCVVFFVPFSSNVKPDKFSNKIAKDFIWKLLSEPKVNIRSEPIVKLAEMRCYLFVWLLTQSLESYQR